MTVHGRARTVLIASALIAVALYAVLWIGYVRQWNWLSAGDVAVLDPLYRFGAVHPGWVTAWNVFCAVLGPLVFRLAVLVLIVILLARRNIRTALFLVITVELSGLLTEVAKDLANRPRPATALVYAPSTSFPSGHALGVMVSVLALLTVVRPYLGPPLRGWLVAAGAVIVVGIGVGRVVLNVHHPSDVAAGWALGYAYFVVCLLILPPVPPVRTADEIPAAPGSAR